MVVVLGLGWLAQDTTQMLVNCNYFFPKTIIVSYLNLRGRLVTEYLRDPVVDILAVAGSGVGGVDLKA